MPFIPPEQLARAREMDLLTYLRCCEPEELVSAGGNTYATRSHDSLKISNGKWYWWSRGVGGSNALDYLTTVRELPLPDAVQRILNAAGAPLAEVPRSKAHTTKIFSLPPKHADNRRVFSYLHGRGIDPEIINHCIKHGLLYESAQHHNCVFVGFMPCTNTAPKRCGSGRRQRRHRCASGICGGEQSNLRQYRKHLHPL